MRIALCDDEKYFHEILKEKLDTYAKSRGMIFLYDEFTDGNSLLESKITYDLIFMDYIMGDLNGVETARRLREKNDKTIVMFLSSYPNAVFDSFEVNTFRFLTKPVKEEKLFKALDDYFLYFTKEEFLVLTDCPKIIRISHNDIIYIEARNKNCIIHLIDKAIEYPRLISELESKLINDRFFRCHRSFFINFAHFKERNGQDLILSNEGKATLSKAKLAEFKSRYDAYLKKYVFEVNTR